MCFCSILTWGGYRSSMKEKVRMADLAKQLGISTVSVSNALAGRKGVSDDLRRKVLALAHETGYTLPWGRRLQTEGVLGIVMAEHFFTENTFYSHLYRCLSLTCGQYGYAPLLTIITAEDEKKKKLPAAWQEKEPDGLIFMGEINRGLILRAAEKGIPCLLLDFYDADLHLPCIVSDNLNGGFMLTRHLLQSGRRQIGFVGSIHATTSIMDRYLGYCRALLANDLTPTPHWRLEDRDASGRLIPLSLPENLPQAFVCSCDEVACRLVQALQEQGLRVPEDVAVAGYDDYRASQLCIPPLTSYHVEPDIMAQQAVATMVQLQTKGMAPLLHTIVPGYPVFRRSTG